MRLEPELNLTILYPFDFSPVQVNVQRLLDPERGQGVLNFGS